MTVDQINDMKHCIGYEQRNVKRGKYIAYRNYYNTGGERELGWDELVEQGYANHWQRFDQHYYCLVQKGFDYLQEILGVKITEMD